MPGGVGAVWREVDRFRTDPDWKAPFSKADSFLCGEKGVGDRRAVLSLASMLRQADQARGDLQVDSRTMCAVATALVFAKKGVKVDLEAIGAAMNIDSGPLRQEATDIIGRMKLPRSIKKEFGMEEPAAELKVRQPKERTHAVVDQKKSEGWQKLRKILYDPTWSEAIEGSTSFLKGELGFPGQSIISVTHIAQRAVEGSLVGDKRPSLVCAAAACITARKAGKSFGTWGSAAAKLGVGPADLESTTKELVQKLDFPAAVSEAFGVERIKQPRQAESKLHVPQLPSRLKIQKEVMEGMATTIDGLAAGLKDKISVQLPGIVSAAVSAALKSAVPRLRRDAERSVRAAVTEIHRDLEEQLRERAATVKAYGVGVVASGLRPGPLRDASDGGKPSNSNLPHRIQVELNEDVKVRENLIRGSLAELEKLIPKFSGTHHLNEGFATIASDMIYKYYSKGRLIERTSGDASLLQRVAAASLYYTARRTGVNIQVGDVASAAMVPRADVYKAMSSLSGTLGLDIMPDQADAFIVGLSDRFRTSGMVKYRARAMFLHAFREGEAASDNEKAFSAAAFYLAATMTAISERSSGMPQGIASATRITKGDVIGYLQLRDVDLHEAMRKLVNMTDIPPYQRRSVINIVLGGASEDAQVARAMPNTTIPTTLADAFTDISARLKERYAFDERIVDSAIELYEKNLKKHSGGRVPHTTTAQVLVALACAKADIPIFDVDIADVMGSNLRNLRSHIDKLAAWGGITAKAHSSHSMVEEILRRTELSSDIAPKAIETLRRLDKAETRPSRQPLLRAAAAVCIAQAETGNAGVDSMNLIARSIHSTPNALEGYMHTAAELLGQSRRDSSAMGLVRNRPSEG